MNTKPSLTGPRGAINLTIMYAVHQAFRRELAWLASAADTRDPAFARRWRTFGEYLRIHHTAEDEVLWPALRKALIGHPQQLALLDDTEAEHAGIEPHLSQVAAALQRHDDNNALRASLSSLSDSVTVHLDHEEARVLPLVSTALTQKDWDAFGAAQRHRVGIRGTWPFLTWLLDEASPDMRRQVLALLPLPVRMIYKARRLTSNAQERP